MLKERQKSILEALIQAHIKTAKPVASRDLVDDFGFSFSPATIRSELLELDELGYVEQPHTSAGRIPTDRGYRFFVDNLVRDFSLNARDLEQINEIFEISEVDEFLKELSKAVSKISQIFSAAGTQENDFFYESGFANILEEPEFFEPGNAKMFGKLVDFLDEEIKELLKKDFDEQIFIGRENPLPEAREYSMFLTSWTHPKGFSGFLTLIGPKRTNYSKHKALIKFIRKHE